MFSRSSFFKKCIWLSYKTLNHWSPSSPFGRAVWGADFPVVDWRGWCGFGSRWRHIFILNFSLPPRSEQVNGAVANEIKHVHSPEVILVFRPQIQLIIQGFVYSYLQYSFNWRSMRQFNTISAYLTPSPFRIKADRIFSGSNFTVMGNTLCCRVELIVRD